MNNKNIRRGILPLAALIAAMLPSLAGAELVINPRRAGTSIDVGQIVRDGEQEPITRTGVYLTTSGVYNDRLLISVTLGGLFWYATPEFASPARLVRFGPGVGEARGVYSFGKDPQDPAAKLQFGYFPYKYSETTNLGEYLYRSGTYPGYLWNGGWSYINSAAYMAQGAHLQVPMLNGMLTHDFTLFMERDVQPINDFTPGYALTVRPAPFLELGAGVVWSHAISFDSQRLSPKLADNRYSKSTGRPTKAETTPSPCGSGADTADCGYYTFRGFKGMARAALNLGSLIGMQSAKTGDFKVYGEVALLGIEDQPFYYENKIERMPMMLGVTIPTFGVLDRLSVEVEYYKNRYPNTIYYPFDSQLGIPVPLGDAGSENDPNNFTDAAVDANPDAYNKNDWKWSVYASRRLIEGISLTTQVASDHQRHFNPEAKPSNEPATLTPDEWYYVVRLDFGIF